MKYPQRFRRSASRIVASPPTAASPRNAAPAPIRSATHPAAVVLNVTADHMDRYASMADYARAKARIFAKAATWVLNADDPLAAAMAEPAADRIVTFSTRGTDADFTIM